MSVLDKVPDREIDVNDDDPSCPDCGGEVLRMISAPKLRFKGSGFHCNDYGRYRPKRS